jgi:hypothetical protein
VKNDHELSRDHCGKFTTVRLRADVAEVQQFEGFRSMPPDDRSGNLSREKQLQARSPAHPTGTVIALAVVRPTFRP